MLELMRLGRRAAVEEGAVDLGSAGPLLDGAAIAAYRARLQRLKAAGGPADEIAFLEAELGAGAGRGGRERFAGRAAEKARVNLTQRIRAAIQRLAAADEALGRYLADHVRTGLSCRFEP